MTLNSITKRELFKVITVIITYRLLPKYWIVL